MAAITPKPAGSASAALEPPCKAQVLERPQSAQTVVTTATPEASRMSSKETTRGENADLADVTQAMGHIALEHFGEEPVAGKGDMAAAYVDEAAMANKEGPPTPSTRQATRRFSGVERAMTGSAVEHADATPTASKLASKRRRRLPSEAYWRKQREAWALASESRVSLYARLHQVKERDPTPHAEGARHTTARANAPPEPRPAGAPRHQKPACAPPKRHGQRPQCASKRLPRGTSRGPVPAAPGADAAAATLRPVKPAGPPPGRAGSRPAIAGWKISRRLQPAKTTGQPPSRTGSRPACAGRKITRGVESGLVFETPPTVPGSLLAGTGGPACTATNVEASRPDTMGSFSGPAGVALLRIGRKRQ